MLRFGQSVSLNEVNNGLVLVSEVLKCTTALRKRIILLHVCAYVCGWMNKTLFLTVLF